MASGRWNPARITVLAEKTRYPFAAYPTVRCATALFCGCSLPAQFPRTTDALAQVAREHGAGVVYDCCGRPLVEWGASGAAGRQGARLRRRLARLGCERLVVACPNCLVHLRELLQPDGICCQSVYEALREWDVAPAGGFGEGVLFPPCPDRSSRELESGLRALAPSAASLTSLKGVPCCGLAGAVAARGPEAVCACGERALAAAGNRPICTLCASCAGQFVRLGCASPVRHALSVLLGVDEAPDVSRAFWNRARRRFDRNLNPIAPVPASAEGAPWSR